MILVQISASLNKTVFCEKIYTSEWLKILYQKLNSFQHYLANIYKYKKIVRKFQVDRFRRFAFGEIFVTNSESSDLRKARLHFWEPLILITLKNRHIVSPKLLAGLTLKFRSIFLNISFVLVGNILYLWGVLKLRCN